MSGPHQLAVLSDSKNVEAVHPDFILEGQMQAREKTIRLYSKIKDQLKVGINEIDARKMAVEIASDLGASAHWHQPYIRIGTGTAISFHEPLQEKNILQPNLPVYIDLGPVWFDAKTGLKYEGDYGDTFVLGENPEAQQCIDWTRKLFNEVQTKWREEKISGQAIYRFLESRCTELGYVLAPDFDGHRLSDFPHQKYTAERLATIPFVPKESFWILEMQVCDPAGRFGAFFEDLLQ